MSKHKDPTFGTDGVRGIVNRDLTAHFAMKLGMAAADTIGKHSVDRRVAIGKDTRISGDMLESALIAGLTEMGCSVVLLGIVPTPAVAHAVLTGGMSAGAVISASHNPFYDNGIKFFGRDGGKLSDVVQNEISTALSQLDDLPRAPERLIGRIDYNSTYLTDAYVASLVDSMDGVTLEGLSLVLDCANGATAIWAPKLFSLLGADVTTLGDAPDGVNINDGCGSLHPQPMVAEVKRLGADAGLAFDGDGDRIIMCDANGNIIDGDCILWIIAQGMKQRGQLTGDKVVATIMSNAGLELALDGIGISLERTAVGDRNVTERMNEVEAKLGGEQSGHILFPAHNTTGDGMLSGLRTLYEMRLAGKALAVLREGLIPYPQKREDVVVANRDAWRHIPEVLEAIRAAEARVGRPNWVSVRNSGTEAKVRIMVQDTDQKNVDRSVAEIKTALLTFCAPPEPEEIT